LATCATSAAVKRERSGGCGTSGSTLARKGGRAVTSRGAPSCGSETGTHPLNSEPPNSKTRKEEGFTVSSSLRRPSAARRKVSSTGARGETARRRSDASF
jgi:hypothetical protein